MSENTIRALTPFWLSTIGLFIFAIAAFSKLDSPSFSIAATVASTAIGAAGGASVQSSGKRVDADHIDNIEMNSPKP
ncbi:MAG: hypothetical protein ABI417_21795 [Coleofasciculaceae cyanobacterium]